MKYRVLELRKQRGMTQEELSAKSGISRATIVKLESGNPNVVTTTDTLIKIATALRTSISEIAQ